MGYAEQERLLTIDPDHLRDLQIVKSWSKQVVNHWNEFGPFGLEEPIFRLEKALEEYKKWEK